MGTNIMQRECRSCGYAELKIILSLGKMPLANALLSQDQLKQAEAKYSLTLAFCLKCTLVQILETVDPEILFSDYPYFSSFSDTMLSHSEGLAKSVIERGGLDKNSLVVEIGSNDGYLLQYFKREGIPVLGIEPAKNIAKVAREEKGIPTISEFFDEDIAAKLANEGKDADVVIGNNVLAHVANLNDFVEGVHTILKPSGIAIFEFPYARDMIEANEFDTIYHEHLCYYSLTAALNLFKKHNLFIVDVEKIPIHGGSLRITLSPDEFRMPTSNVENLCQEELRCGLDKLEYYKNFADQVNNLNNNLSTLLTDLKNQGKAIAAYGAAAKGTVLLNYCSIGKEFLDFVVDRSTYKQGRYMPGVHLPIYTPEKLLEVMPDYVLLLAWNFAEEILKQNSEYTKRGGKFIVPIPKIMVI